MRKFYVVSVALAAVLLSSCAPQQVGLKENWIDERDVIALRDGPISEWMVKAGRPVIVELVGDTNVYYYNYRPTMYASVIYGDTIKESKPALENAAEVWGSRRNIIQIKVINNNAVSAIITDGPDKKVFVRDLYGNLILDPNTGFNANISEEQRISSASKDFQNALNSLSGKNTWPPKEGPIVPVAEPAPAAPAPVAATEPTPEPEPKPAAEPAEQAPASHNEHKPAEHTPTTEHKPAEHQPAEHKPAEHKPTEHHETAVPHTAEQ
jgi:hypothetical protein